MEAWTQYADLGGSRCAEAGNPPTMLPAAGYGNGVFSWASVWYPRNQVKNKKERELNYVKC